MLHARSCTIRVELDDSLLILYRTPSADRAGCRVAAPFPASPSDAIANAICQSWPSRVKADDIAIQMIESTSATLHVSIEPHLGLILVQLCAKRDPELMAMGFTSVEPHSHSLAMCEAARGAILAPRDEAVERIAALMNKFGMAPVYIGHS